MLEAAALILCAVPSSACDDEPVALGAVAPLASAGPAEPIEVRPGDTLLDRLADARFERFPATNLPAELAAELSRAFPMRTPPIDPAEWTAVGNPPAVKFRGFIPGGSKLRLWRVKPAIKPDPAAGPVVPLIGGKPAPEWDPASGKLPDPYVYWEEEIASLSAISERAVPDVSVAYFADPVSELGANEPGLAIRDAASAEAPPPAAMGRRIELGGVSRRCVFVPAPSVLSFRIARLAAEELDFSLAVIDAGLRRDGEHFVRAPGASDGALFAVDVECDGATRRVFRRELGREEVGAGFVDARVDLREFAGRDVTLRLVTEPGARGDAAFDYACIGGLRLHGPPAARPAQPHVVIVDVDTLRADRLSWHGCPRETTPRLAARFARDSVIYLDASSQAAWTLPSTASILTGLFVQQHGVDQFPEAIAGTPTLATLLHAQGYETVGFAEGGYVRAAYGFAQGFDLYHGTGFKDPDWKGALEWLRGRRSERPFFLFLHTYFVHAPYEAPSRFEGDCHPPYDGFLKDQVVGYDNVIEPFKRRQLELAPADEDYILRRYDELVAQMDERVGAFLDRLEALIGEDDWILVFTSDHGEEFFEHDALGHGQSLHRELLHVPLVIRYPRGLADRPEPGTRDEPVQSVDIVPTILAAIGVPIPGSMKGRSLLTGTDDPPARLAWRSDRCVSIAKGDWKLIRNTRRPPGKKAIHSFELYDVSTDPGETTDVKDENPRIVVQMNELLERLLAETPLLRDESLGDAQGDLGLDQLDELGYTQRGGSDDDSDDESGADAPRGGE